MEEWPSRVCFNFYIDRVNQMPQGMLIKSTEVEFDNYDFVEGPACVWLPCCEYLCLENASEIEPRSILKLTHLKIVSRAYTFEPAFSTQMLFGDVNEANLLKVIEIEAGMCCKFGNLVDWLLLFKHTRREGLEVKLKFGR